MKIGYKVAQNQVKLSAMGTWLHRIQAYTIISPIPTTGSEPHFPAELEKKLEEAKEKLGLSIAPFYVLEIDGVSNTLCLCPPMFSESDGSLVMDKEQYDKGVRDDLLPVLVVNADIFDALIVVSVWNHMEKRQPETAEKEAVETAKIGGNQG